MTGVVFGVAFAKLEDMTDPIRPSGNTQPVSPATEGGVQPCTEEERRIIDLVNAGLASGPAIPVDAGFFERLKNKQARKG